MTSYNGKILAVGAAAKAPVEEATLDAGLEFTFLHPTLFFQMIAYGRRSTLDSCVLAERWSPETRFSRVGYRDVADVAALITEVTGRPVRAERTRPDPGVPPPLRAMFEHYDRIGPVVNPLPLRAMLGREPRFLAGLLRRTRAERKTA